MRGILITAQESIELVLVVEGVARLVRVSNENTRHCVGWCLEVHDLAASKLAAGREKDLEYVSALIRHRMVDAAVLRDRPAALPLPDVRRAMLHRVLARLLAES